MPLLNSVGWLGNPLWISQASHLLCLICWFGHSVLCTSELTAQGEPWTKVEVFPSELQVSANYPAKLMVLATTQAGAMLDLSRSPELRLELVDSSSTAALELDGLQVRLRPAAVDRASAKYAARVTLGKWTLDVPITIADSGSPHPAFAREISAVLSKTGCNQGTCHGNLHGKGGFRLSLRGDDPRFDFEAIVGDARGRRIDPFAAQLSLLLRKPAGQLAHQGGVRLPRDSVAYQWLSQWISDGCRWNATDAIPPTESALAADEQVVQLQVFPAQALLEAASRKQQLIVIAEFASGRRRDVTQWAKFEASSPTGVEISAEGLVQVDRAIDLGVSVSYLSGRAATRLTFLPDHAPTRTTHEATQPTATSTPTPLDTILERQLSRLRITPRPLAEDSVLLRRMYLTTLGRLPTVAEAEQYLNSLLPDKRQRLIEKLLRDPAFAQLWALHWSDLLRNEQKVMSPRGTQQWHAWMSQQIERDVPLNRFVSQMLTSVGSTYENPPASFHRTHRDPETAAETVGQVFLGVRIQCARCHNHPFDNWRQDDYYGLAAYFAPLQREQIANDPRDKNDKHIITGDEIITLAAAPAEIWHPGLARSVPPKPLMSPQSPMPDEMGAATASPLSTERPNTENSVAAPQNSLEALSQWLTQDNRLFARNMANRIWFHLMGRGIVDPPDDFRDSNPASHPELLEYLTDQLIHSDYSTRYLSRLILNSQAFARAAVEADSSLLANSLSAADAGAVEKVREPGLDAEALFAGYPLRRMPAETLYDAISDVTAVYSLDQAEKAPSRNVALPTVPEQAGFLTAFGKPGRLLACECERSNSVSLGQSLMMVNGPEVREKLVAPHNRLQPLSSPGLSTQQILDELYLAALTRWPSQAEAQALTRYLESHPDRRAALEDIVWALLNSKEFSLIR